MRDHDLLLAPPGWPDGRVGSSTYLVPVVPRRPVPAVKASPEQKQVWSADGYSVDELRYTPDGQLDATFDGDGIATAQWVVSPGLYADAMIRTVAVQPEPPSPPGGWRPR